jgi:hypothetical protein
MSEVASFDFEKTEILKPMILVDDSISMSATLNNNGISTLFDNFVLSLQSEKDALRRTVTTGFRVPVKTVPGKAFVYYSQQLRGAITKDKDSRIVLLIDLAGKTTIIEFPFGQKFDGELVRSFPRKIKAAKDLTYSAAFSVLVERRNLESVVDIQIDSFDLTVSSTAQEQ